MKDLQWYTEFMFNELKVYSETRFIGNVGFKLNFYNGKITNIVAEQHKSVKMPEEQYAVRNTKET